MRALSCTCRRLCYPIPKLTLAILLKPTSLFGRSISGQKQVIGLGQVIALFVEVTPQHAKSSSIQKSLDVLGFCYRSCLCSRQVLLFAVLRHGSPALTTKPPVAECFAITAEKNTQWWITFPVSWTAITRLWPMNFFYWPGIVDHVMNHFAQIRCFAWCSTRIPPCHEYLHFPLSTCVC